MKGLMIAMIGVMAAGIASAKLPPLSDEAKAKAAEAKAKAAWSDKVAAYKLCLAQDRVVESYRKNKGSEVKSTDATAPAVTPTSTQAASSGTAPAAAAAAAPAPVPPCQDPGPYVATNQATGQVGVADSKPEPAAGKPPAPAEPKK